jgi:ABC-type polysaccharide/polyol phosphate transport system ATPase subunit
MKASLRADRLGVRFQFDRQQRVVTPILAHLRRRGTETWGLHDLTFSVGPGEGIALIGASGSGKTTLLRLLAGVLSPDAGSLEVTGRVGSLLSTEAGLLWHLTGRENAEMLGILAGLSRTDSRAALEGIKRATRLGDAFERPVMSYSEGMRARLGFAVADETDPSILLLDEVHEALDHAYRQIVAGRAEEILRRGGIVLAAGHDHPLLETICDRAIWMAEGVIVRDGAFEEVRREYLSHAAP